MAKANLSPELERKYSHALTETLDRIDGLRADLKEETKRRKGEIAQHEKAAFRLRRLLSGKESEQLEVPGSEIPQVAPSKGLTSITLRTAEGEVTATPTQVQAALDELERRKKGSPESLIAWAHQGPGWTGTGAKGRKYSLTSGPGGWSWQLHGTFTGAGGAGPFPTLTEAKTRAELRESDLRGNAILKNAGAGEHARKKGGRRG